MEIVRKKLTAAEIQPPNTRYSSDCDCVQTTPDDGTTWNDAPGLDPRKQAGWQLPPRGGTDPRCAAAANMVGAIRHFVDTMNDAATAQGIATLMLGLLGAFLPLGLVVDLVIIVASAIWEIGVALLKAAMTEAQYDILLCAFYCNLQADGTLTPDGYAALYPYVEANMEATAAGFCERMFDLLGYVGLTNAGATGSLSADCSGCECIGCAEADWTVGDGGSLTHDYAGDYADADGWQSICISGVADGVNIQQLFSNDGMKTCNYTHAEFDVQIDGGNWDWYILGLTNHDVPTHDQVTLASGNTSVTGLSTLGGDVDGSAYYGLQLILAGTGACGNTAFIRKARIYSSNLNHAGLSPNC